MRMISRSSMRRFFLSMMTVVTIRMEMVVNMVRCIRMTCSLMMISTMTAVAPMSSMSTISVSMAMIITSVHVKFTLSLEVCFQLVDELLALVVVADQPRFHHELVYVDQGSWFRQVQLPLVLKVVLLDVFQQFDLPLDVCPFGVFFLHCTHHHEVVERTS